MARVAAGFDSVTPETYDRYVGRYGPALSRAHLRLLGLRRRDDVLEVGCGPGALTEALAREVGAGHVFAVEPAEGFADACRRRVPGAHVRVGSAERLPDFGRAFAAATSQLVLNFMSDADTGVRAMADAVRDGGVVTSVVWDYKAGMRMLRAFWDAALELDRDAPDEGRTMAHCTPAGLRALWLRVGLDDVRTGALDVEASYDDYADFWAPFPTGVGAAGAYCSTLDPDHREALRRVCFRRLGSPEGPFRLAARAWFVRGTVARR
ncbi:class I SAM-dependent methyltransferase [Gaiella sp.]|uniref:class I SAM-dependent methyltransferase n=1 Tax=Gaiella sp. TaxID=2663207 RepID=UPI002E32BE39|nr:class I SAM-dependent methyltransferase [Gaiella sp.]HEX5583676.1 class I SAM-dependent methyltransferase [Gaiella sp.]